ncbi:YoaK family protein [Pediococcus claussenii]|uniref:YoaK family protein n=1 Tax=Pediococcus claussenii TaxID=187452 RepID=UPI0007052DCD|nr:YoaK family protein [Pediococcus claussenii]ANZ70241.1 hypothetical protein AYR57_07915 [Pediococcus claussenii]ANZ72057.1 hypothetical protein AYR58_07915 [Pediococcus claussenii]
MKKFKFYERLMSGALLALTAGSIDAYTYLVHGGVFAGLQTGNVILLGIHIGEGKFAQAVPYLFSILMFMLGTILIRIVQHVYEEKDPEVHQHLVIYYEIILLIVVMLTSSTLPNMLVTGMLSMVAAAQLQAFRQLKNGPFTSLMMTGNIRTVADSLYTALVKNDQVALRKAKDISVIILSFLGGAIITGVLVQFLGGMTIAVAITALLLILGLRLLDSKNK